MNVTIKSAFKFLNQILLLRLMSCTSQSMFFYFVWDALIAIPFGITNPGLPVLYFLTYVTTQFFDDKMLKRFLTSINTMRENKVTFEGQELNKIDVVIMGIMTFIVMPTIAATIINLVLT